MKCPHCQTADLVMSDRQGVEVDYCPQCRGVWLDRGELDKILERSARYEAQYAGGHRRDDDDDDDDDKRRRYAPPPAGGAYPPQPYPPQQHYPRKKSFWSELFD
ncbi:MAG TPA: zf-TFIIB domain-containing protein [Humisphaera sp.]